MPAAGRGPPRQSLSDTVWRRLPEPSQDKHAQEKPRKFVETIELQIGLKDYDTQRDKRRWAALSSIELHRLAPVHGAGNRSLCILNST